MIGGFGGPQFPPICEVGQGEAFQRGAPHKR
jgi:hypothetical protein